MYGSRGFTAGRKNRGFEVGESIVTILVSMFACNGFWTYIQYKTSKKQNAQDAKGEALMALLQDRLRYLCMCYIKDGQIHALDLASLHKMFAPYERLGGNGEVKVLMEQVDKLPVIQ